MKIFFDASPICWGYSGIPVYVRQLVSHLSESQEIELHFGLKSVSMKTHNVYRQLLSEIVKDKLEYHRILLPGRLEMKNSILHKLSSFNSKKYDLMHYPAFLAPGCAEPSDLSNVILTVHDMFPFTLNFTKNFADYLSRRLRTATDRSDGAVTVRNYP